MWLSVACCWCLFHLCTLSCWCWPDGLSRPTNALLASINCTWLYDSTDRPQNYLKVIAVSKGRELVYTTLSPAAVYLFYEPTAGGGGRFDWDRSSLFLGFRTSQRRPNCIFDPRLFLSLSFPPLRPSSLPSWASSLPLPPSLCPILPRKLRYSWWT